MKTNRILSAAILAAAVLSGCSSMPAADSPLVLARNDYNAAQSNPQVTNFAAGELQTAGNSLARANAAQDKGEKAAVVDHLAYVARQQVAIAQQTASQKAAEQAIANASAERDRVRLAARTREADSAQRNAEASQRSAEASQRQSEASQRQSEASLRQSEASRQSAEASQRQSQAAQRNAQDSQRDAEAAQRMAAAERQAATDAQMNAQAANQRTQDAQANAQAANLRTQDAQLRASRLEDEIRALEAKKTERGLVITLGDVLFDTNRAQLRPNGMRSVQKLADFFRQYPQRKVLIEGFTDSTGGAGSNQDLSENRAASVRTALLDMGVGIDRITSRGYGESFPVAGNDTATGRQMNRRVEMIVSDDSGKITPR